MMKQKIYNGEALLTCHELKQKMEQIHSLQYKRIKAKLTGLS
ncbi:MULTISPECIES: hypothetical protein [Bacillati]